jgi:hypothetical protein
MITSTARIEIRETDGLNESNHTLHIEINHSEPMPHVGGPRGIVIDQHNMQQLDVLLKEICSAIIQLRPTIQTVAISFYEP